MRIESATMPHRQNQVAALEKRLKEIGVSKKEFLGKLGIDNSKTGLQTYNNWRTRGIPARLLLDIARIARCEPEPLKLGRIVPVADPSLPLSVAENRLEHDITLSQEALDVAHAFQELPDGLKNHIRTFLDDYIVSVAPMLKSIYRNANRASQDRFNRIIEEAQRRDKARRAKKSA